MNKDTVNKPRPRKRKDAKNRKLKQRETSQESIKWARELCLSALSDADSVKQMLFQCHQQLDKLDK